MGGYAGGGSRAGWEPGVGGEAALGHGEFEMTEKLLQTEIWSRQWGEVGQGDLKN